MSRGGTERRAERLDGRTPAAGMPRVPDARVALSTASTYPEPIEAAFEMASRLGYDGIEVMVFTDPVSQDVDEVRRLSDAYEVPILSVHAPCLLVTQRVWGSEPWAKLDKSKEMAEAVGATTVVVHPPFRWQRDYAKAFVGRVRRMHEETAVRFAVENMYPWRAAGRAAAAYAPGWDPTEENYDYVTLDLSHTAVSGSDAVDMARALGDRLAHLHLADGSGSGRDEHLVPGRGTQRCADVLELLAASGFGGTVVVEISTRRLVSRDDRESDLAEALAFARLNLAAPADRSGQQPTATP